MKVAHSGTKRNNTPKGDLGLGPKDEVPSCQYK